MSYVHSIYALCQAGRLRLSFDFRISDQIFLIQKLLQPQANSKDNLDKNGCGNRIPVILKRLKIIKNHQISSISKYQ